MKKGEKDQKKTEAKKRRTEVLLATLGTEPQVVTITLDELTKRGYSVDKVVLVFTESPAVIETVEILKNEFSKQQSQIEVVECPVQSNGKAVEDFLTQETLKALMATLYSRIRELKEEKLIIHLLISGGRKIMGIIAMLIAQLLFGEEDHIWYLITEGWKPGDNRKLHLSEQERAWVVEIPVIHWSEASTLIRTVAQISTPEDVGMWYRKLNKNAQLKRKKEFVEHWLTPAEKDLVKVVCQGYDNEQISKILSKTEQTIANQLQKIYEKLREWMDYPDRRVDRNLLIAEFAPYFSLNEENI
ncbi:MAG: CRISPR-associated protein Csx14 [Pseudothermotoga sp.]